MKQNILHNKTPSAHRITALVLLLLLSGIQSTAAQPCTFTLARLKYDGGGDWYANPSSLPNLAEALQKRTTLPICDTIATANLDDDQLFRYPFIYMTGHGEVRFSLRQQLRLRKYLLGGGFLWADDNYGMDASLRRELSRLFPETPLTPLPSGHPVFKSHYTLSGLPKIHEHDGKPAQASAVVIDNRVVVLYTWSADIGDGMENLDVHNDGPALHELALKMGINIVTWFFAP